jgi:hypothetical protein
METVTQRVVSRIQRANRSSRLIRITDAESTRFSAIMRLRRCRRADISENANRISNWSRAHVYQTWLMTATLGDISAFATEQRLFGGAA